MTIITSTTVLTANDVAGQVNSKGLDALGLTVPAFGTVWSDSSAPSPTVDPATLRLTINGLTAPFTCTYVVVAHPYTYAGLSGAPITTAAGVLALHPEAIHRLETSVRSRLGAAAVGRPLPVAMLVHGLTAPAHPLMSWFRGGESLGVSGAASVSFHDRRGLIIDPLAVASLFADLLSWRPALAGAGSTLATSSAGGVATIAALTGAALRVHVINPHGTAYRSMRTGSEVSVLDGTGASVSIIPAGTGLANLAAGQSVGLVGSTVASPPDGQVIWGPAPGGTLGKNAWTPPALPTGGGAPTLAHQFFRLIAVDLDWHLLGNRAFAPGADAPAEDDMPAGGPLPVVRRTVPGFDYLVDGNDVLGAMGAMSASWPVVADRLGLLCSPVITPALTLPPGTGNAGHWPGFPGPIAPTPGDGAAVKAFDPLPPAPATPLVTANWRVPASGPDRDVVVTFAAGSLPAGTHVRVFPRTFQVIRGIGADPSFVRGDGGSSVVDGSGATVLLLNPFALGAVEPVPSPAHLSVDIVAVARDGTRRMASAVDLVVGTEVPWVDNTARFGGTASAPVAAMIAGQGFTSIAPVSAFAIPAPTGTGAHPGSGAPVIDWVKWLANEGSWPRIGPHLPTQARFETVLALGAVTASGTPYAWTAVLTGGRYDWESRCAAPQLGDPGNPAGPDAHLSGVRVGGQLAYDLAMHALKRCQSVVPTAPNTGWIVVTDGNNWNVPPADPAPAAGLPHIAGALLETISALTDSPELSLLPIPADTDSIQSLASSVANAISPGSTVAVTIANEPRLRRELQREIATAKRGQRDAMWSIARAVAEAREYVFIESAMFSRTARDADTHLVDLVTLLKDRLVANPRLKVMICLPRLPDFDPGKDSWVRGAFRDRKEALELLTGAGGAGGMRVAAFHPIGYPGRSTVGRSAVILVDDVYAVVGTSHWRRRGMTFDGSCDVVSLDRRLDDRGVSGAIARYRQELLATRLGIPIPTSAADTSALWTRLAEPESAYDVLVDLLSAGGLGRCSAVYAGPTDTSVLPEAVDTIDPNGLAGQSLVTLLTGLIP
jgi:hypothetical protein